MLCGIEDISNVFFNLELLTNRSPGRLDKLTKPIIKDKFTNVVVINLNKFKKNILISDIKKFFNHLYHRS